MTSQQGRHGEDLVQVMSVLTLTDVKSSDAGIYQCVASNIVAAIYSTQAAITVSGKCNWHICDPIRGLVYCLTVIISAK